MQPWRFANRDTESLFLGRRVKRFSGRLAEEVQEKLSIVYYAVSLNDLRCPPGNRLEKLSGDRAGQWSIRINKQWRICFVWHNEMATLIEVVDYH